MRMCITVLEAGELLFAETAPIELADADDVHDMRVEIPGTTIEVIVEVLP